MLALGMTIKNTWIFSMFDLSHPVYIFVWLKLKLRCQLKNVISNFYTPGDCHKILKLVLKYFEAVYTFIRESVLERKPLRTRLFFK